MVFSSLVFLFYFLPILLLLYYAVPSRFRNVVALIGSLVFYAWGAPKVAVLLPLTCWADYALGNRIASCDPARSRYRRSLLICAVTLNLALLMVFKYANFAVEQVNALLGGLGLRELHWTAIALPIGISFFTFQKITYVVDVYRGVVKPARLFSTYLLYVVLFSQLIAGPIARYHDVAEQLERRGYFSERFLSGVARFCIGLARKVLIANPLGEVADFAFGLSPSTLSTPAAWLGVVCYSFQIYFDFAGYSDMAIGLGRMLGIEFLENFNFPYIARNFTGFWHRWHISLSNFMRDYVYIPLGGNRVGPIRASVNLWLVFMLSGFWHGAAWNFLVWGTYHGLFLSLDKFLKNTRWSRMPGWAAVPLNFVLIMIGWVLFRCDSLSHALRYLFCMAGDAAATATATPIAAHLLGPRTWATLAVAVLFSFLPTEAIRERFVRVAAETCRTPTAAGLRFALSAVLLILSAGALAVSGFNPFIYFRF